LNQYFRGSEPNKLYKLTQEQDKVWLYWVTLHRMADGSFQHGRGRDLIPSWEKGIEICRLMAVPATEAEYLTVLRRYLLADQSARPQLLEDEKKK
jgi:hypothetical protein